MINTAKSKSASVTTKVKEETSLLINLSWSSHNAEINSLIGKFDITDYHYCNKTKQHRISVLNQTKSTEILTFLSSNKIPATATQHTETLIFIYFDLMADIYMQPNHHIELRAI